MTRLEKMIGFPVPQEHRKELNERLNTYENCDRTTLISLLLQYDWELLQLRENIQGKISLEVFREKMSAEELYENALKAQKNSHQVIFGGGRSHGKSYAVAVDVYKRMFIEKAVEWFRHQKEEIGISWFDDYEIRFREAMEEL